ncbi:hypothetical protein DFP73DRAFT_532075 [Morchella snyderi]|nr:hypothetical protein DFP73DRAFT_532075 [Morchella snyderi]
MVTQQGAPKARGGTGTITTSTINRLSNPRTDLPSPPILDRRSSLPPLGGGGGGQDDTGDDHECTGEYEELDSHITLTDSMDLDSVSSTTDDPSPRTRTRRLCQAPGSKCSHAMPRRHTGGQRGQLDFGLPKVIDDATSIMGKIHDREVIEVKRNRDYHPQRVGSAQSGRSIESRSSTSNSIREEEEQEAEEEERRRKNGGEKMGRQMSASGARPEVYRGVSEEVRRKGPISELQTSPGRRRQRPAHSVESLGFDRKDGEGEDGEQVGATISAWGRRRMENQPVGSKKSSLEYSKEEKDAETAALEEISKGKEKMVTNGSDTAPAATSNGGPVRPGQRRTGGSFGGPGTIRAPGTLMNGSSNGFERGGKGSVIPVSGGSGGSGAGASKTRKAADEKEGTRNRSPTITQQRASPPLGRPASGLSLRSGLPRPSNSGPNTPIKTSKSSIPSPAPPIRAKTGLPSPSNRHERTKSSAPSSSALHRSHSSTSATSATSATTSPSANANAAAAAATTTSASTTSRFQGSSTIRSREPPKLRGFAGSAAQQPSTVHETSKEEDISRMPESPLPFGMTKSSSSSGQSSSRPSSSHSAIYSPTSATGDKKQEEEHHHIVEHLETLRKLTRFSPPGSNRSSWSTEAEEAAGDEQKPRERRREERKKKDDERKDAEREAAKLKDIIASIDSLGKDQEIRSPSRLSRTKSLDSLLSNRAALEAEKKTPSRPRSAGRDSETSLKLFSPTSEMGDFTARLLRSPAVEDYEDLLNLVDSDKEEEEQRDSKNVRERQSSREPISPPMSPESLNSPIAEKHSGTVEEPQETTRPGKLRRAIIKTAIIKKTVRPRSLVIPKRSILEEDSDDSLDHLIKHDQDFSALLKPGSSDDEDDVDSIEVLVASGPYDPQETKDQPVRSVSDATTGDRQSEAERAVHEKLMNRLKTLQLEVRSATRGIEVLEQWLQSPGRETISSGSSSDIISDISEQEEILYRLRCDEERQRLRLQTKILEDTLKRRNSGWSWMMWLLKWGFVVLLGMALWMAIEVAIFVSQMPPEFSRVPVVLKDPPPVGTRPTRAIVFTAIWLFRHAWTAIHSIGHALWLLTEYISAAPDRITELWARFAGAPEVVEEIVQEAVETIIESAAEEVVWGAEFMW